MYKPNKILQILDDTQSLHCTYPTERQTIVETISIQKGKHILKMYLSTDHGVLWRHRKRINHQRHKMAF